MNSKEAQRVAPFVGVEDGRVVKAAVPGHQGRRYTVQLRRKNGGLTASCQQNGGGACPGATVSVCYHQLGSVVALAASKQETVYFPNSGQRVDAERLARLHNGKVIWIESRQSGRRAWGVVKGPREVRWDETLDDMRASGMEYSEWRKRRDAARNAHLQERHWDTLAEWGEAVDDLAGWYDAALVKAVDKHGVAGSAERDALRQLQEKYPGQPLLEDLEFEAARALLNPERIDGGVL